MKRTFLKKRSDNPRKRLLTKADDKLQDYYRIIWADKKCEGCGGKMELCHHYILKCHSNTLRFNTLNLIPICKICHSKVHGFHGEIINAQIILKRGRRWLNELRALERIKTTLTINQLKEIIEKYK